MNKIIYKGVKEFNGKEIKVLEGGFGENKRILTEKQIANVHNMEIKEVRKSIKRLVLNNRMKEDVDFIDIKPQINSLPMDLDDFFGIKQEYLSRTENIFILSERGYSKLVKSMDDDSSWEIMDKLIDEYFSMREIINSDEQKIAQLTLSIYKGGQDALISAKELSELEVAKAVKPLNEKIATDKPLVEFAEQVSGTADFIDIGDFAKILNDENIKIGRNRLFNWLRDNKYIMKSTNIPYQNHIDNGMFKVIEVTKNSVYGTKIFPKTVLSGSGQLKLMSKIKQDYEKGLIK